MRLNIAGMDLECRWIEYQTNDEYCITQYIFLGPGEPMAIPLVGTFTPPWDAVKDLAMRSLLTIWDTSPLDENGS